MCYQIITTNIYIDVKRNQRLLELRLSSLEDSATAALSRKGGAAGG